MSSARLTIIVLFVLCAGQLFSQYWGKQEYAATVDEIGWFVYEPATRFQLSEEVKETSGLILFNGLLWTHNDSGGDPVIYGIDTLSGEIVRRITLDGATNRDWEDIAQDSLYIFVGDFGNNKGERQDLAIYRLLKEEILPEGDDIVRADKIEFTFSDQQDFDHGFQMHDYDCESMFAFGDRLFLLSKSWITGKSRIYVLPKEPGSYSASVSDTFDVDGLATGAAVDRAGKRLAIIGYKDFYPFLWIFDGIEEGNIFHAHKIRIDFPFYGGAQTEGVEFLDSTRVVFSCEKSAVPPQIFELPVPEPGKMLPSPSEIPEYFDNWEVILYEKKKKNEKEIVVDITGLQSYTFSIYFQDAENKVINLHNYYFDKQMGKLYMRFDARSLSEGRYDVILRSGYGEWIKKVVIR